MFKLMDAQNCQINLASTFHNILELMSEKPARAPSPVSHYVTRVSDVDPKKAMSYMKTFTMSSRGLST